MSWYRDPALFIYSNNSQYYVARVSKVVGTNPVLPNDLKEGDSLVFSKHLSLGNNKASDYDALKASLNPKSGIGKLINSKGFVINWDISKGTGTWSREEPNSSFWSLPGVLPDPILAEIQSLREENSELKSKLKLEEESKRIKTKAIEEETAVLKAQLKREKEQIEATEAASAIVKAQLRRERKEKESTNIRVLNLEAGKVSLEAEVSKERDEKEAMNQKVFNLEAEISILKAEVKREREEKSALINAINALNRDDILARLEALEKQVLDVTFEYVTHDM